MDSCLLAPFDVDLSAGARRLAKALSILSFLIAASQMLLWGVGSQRVLAVLTTTMKPNTSVSLTLLSISLFLFSFKESSPRLVLGQRVLASLGGMIGFLTLLEYLLGVSFHMDELYRKDLLNEESLLFPGRMAPNAAFGLWAVGSYLVFHDWSSGTAKKTLHLGLFVSILISGMAIIGYWYQASALYQLAFYIRISPYTSWCLLFLCLGVYSARPLDSPTSVLLSSGPDGKILRRLLPPVILLPVLFCWVAVKLRDAEWVNRPTMYSLLAIFLVVSFTTIIWMSAQVVSKTNLQKTEDRLKSVLAERDQSLQTLATINRVGQALISQLDLEKLVQSVTDAATQLSGAQFGAFFYTVVDVTGQSYLLFTISGVEKEKFSSFPLPRNTEVFNPTFMNLGTVRSDDITQDPRYGKGSYHGMPPGHLPVKSYLAVSVTSRSGEVIGGLFFGHEKRGVFTAQSEAIVEGLAAQAAVAMDNAKLYTRLQESVKARDEFLSMASHELKTPLTSLMLQSQIRNRQLEKGLGSLSSHEVKKMIEDDNRQFRRLGRLIDEMLDISMINMRRLEIHTERLNLSDLVREVIEKLRPQLVESCGDPLLFFEDVWVQADPFRMEQVIVNLLMNAIKYGRARPIEVSVQRQNLQAIVSIKDQGIGISKSDQTRIFSRFERAVSSQEVSGLGLGLSIAKDIVEAHGGQIGVESELGAGATFIIHMDCET